MLSRSLSYSKFFELIQIHKNIALKKKYGLLWIISVDYSYSINRIVVIVFCCVSTSIVEKTTNK